MPFEVTFNGDVCSSAESFLVSYHKKKKKKKKKNPELKQTFAQYGVNTPRLDRLGSKVRQRVHCCLMQRTFNVFFLKVMLSTADLGQKRYFLRRTLFAEWKIL